MGILGQSEREAAMFQVPSPPLIQTFLFEMGLGGFSICRVLELVQFPILPTVMQQQDKQEPVVRWGSTGSRRVHIARHLRGPAWSAAEGSLQRRPDRRSASRLCETRESSFAKVRLCPFLKELFLGGVQWNNHHFGSHFNTHAHILTHTHTPV